MRRLLLSMNEDGYKCSAGWVSLNAAGGLSSGDQKRIIGIALSVLSPYGHTTGVAVLIASASASASLSAQHQHQYQYQYQYQYDKNTYSING